MTKKLSKLSTAENSVRMSLKEGGGESTNDLELFINESKEELAGIASYGDCNKCANSKIKLPNFK